jgi:hypothetical protein
MNRRRLAWLAGLPLLAGLGCFQEQNSLLVPSSPFSPPSTPPKEFTSLAPATQEAALRVLSVGKNLVTSNPQFTGLGPANFATIGSPTPEIFHVGGSRIVITEGLVKECDTDAKLAGVLAMQMGKMLADREAQAGQATRNPHREPPPAPLVGMEGGGSRGAADLIQKAEQAPFEENRKRQMHPPSPPDPKVIAKLVLQKAGYAESDLEAVEPILKTAQENSALEKQMTNTNTARQPWIK